MDTAWLGATWKSDTWNVWMILKREVTELTELTVLEIEPAFKEYVSALREHRDLTVFPVLAPHLAHLHLCSRTVKNESPRRVNKFVQTTLRTHAYWTADGQYFPHIEIVQP